MKESLYFYDLETSGVNPRQARIMQFAGQRTDQDLNPIGEPHNILVRLTDDVLPEPDAVMITGITPQKTLEEGVTEAEFCKIFASDIAQPNTTFVGFNNIRFDDEFMRFTLYRNFYDPYEWQWKDGSSRWDLLDVSRMARALRPEGVTWPVVDGKPSNRLELLASENHLEHDHAHDALSDVLATIGLAKLLKNKQPKLFEYMYNLRDKKRVEALVSSSEPFVYSTGKYSGDYEKTSIAVSLGDHPERQGILVYDLRHDPQEFFELSPEQLADRWKYKKDSTEKRLPIKALQFNRCPAVAPMSVMDEQTAKRLSIDLDQVNEYREKLMTHPEFVPKLHKALKELNKGRKQETELSQQNVDGALYDKFISDADRATSRTIRSSDPDELEESAEKLQDKRLKLLAPLYKARNFPQSLSDAERSDWEEFRKQALTAGGTKSQMARFTDRMNALAQGDMSDEKQYLLEELSLYAQSIAPVDF